MNKIAIFLALVLLMSCTTSYRPKSLLSMEEYAVATQADHFVACKMAVKYECGITLSECTDMMKYECTQSVIIININDLRSAYEEQ